MQMSNIVNQNQVNINRKAEEDKKDNIDNE